MNLQNILNQRHDELVNEKECEMWNNQDVRQKGRSETSNPQNVLTSLQCITPI